MKWSVVPICTNQKKDVNPIHLLKNGLYRLCDVYKGGGGYDKYPHIFYRRYGVQVNPIQFVVQLKGCPLNCPYCYVTRNGVDGVDLKITTEELIKIYKELNVDTFHLMGGAPAIYLKNWHCLYEKLGDNFHSDFILVEGIYNIEDLKKVRGLHAVSLKEKYIYSPNQLSLLWSNLDKIVSSGINFYITFTGKDEWSTEIEKRYGLEILKDSFTIPIIKYESIS